MLFLYCLSSNVNHFFHSGTREELNKYKAGIIKHGDDDGDSLGSKDSSKLGSSGIGSGDEKKSEGGKINGTLDPEVLELRRQIEKQATDLGSAHRSLSDLRGKNAEYEERMMQINKELHGAQEFAKNLEIDLKVKLIVLIVKDLFIGELGERSKQFCHWPLYFLL